jgi:hypothetical protein
MPLEWISDFIPRKRKDAEKEKASQFLLGKSSLPLKVTFVVSLKVSLSL